MSYLRDLPKYPHLRKPAHAHIKKIIGLSLFAIVIFSLLPYVTFFQSSHTTAYGNLQCVGITNNVCKAYDAGYPFSNNNPFTSSNIQSKLSVNTACTNNVSQAIEAFAKTSGHNHSYEDCIVYMLDNIPGL